ncbi:MAG TPA: PEGA domain-containing protein [Candidatus Polarisedimenticolia bacterium]|nr:PEGA domain-containing protein [Candidatus Polarisedimenticolia bacterium]
MIRFRSCLPPALAAAAVLIPGHAAAGQESLRDHMQARASVAEDPAARRLPSVEIGAITAAVPLDDRIDADQAFDAPYVESLRDGLAWYLARKGVRVVGRGGTLRVAGKIVAYEGWRRPGRSGAALTLRARVYEDGRVRLTESLSAEMRVRSETAAVRQAREDQGGDGADVQFSEMLFAALSADLAGQVYGMLLKAAPAGPSAVEAMASVEPASSAGGTPGPPSWTLERGVLTIEASARHAEVLIDGVLVGTTPLVDLILAAGPHKLEVRKEGFVTWQRDIHVIGRAASRFFAELRTEPPPDR